MLRLLSHKLLVGLLALTIFSAGLLLASNHRSSAAVITESRTITALGSQDPATGYRAAITLGEQGATATLLRALDNSDATVRMRAAMALGVAGDPSAVPALAVALQKGGPEAGEAAKALTKIGGQAAEDALFQALLDDQLTPRRMAAFQALAAQGESARAMLDKAELSGIPSLRGAAADLKARLSS
jgi:HEAT repeat protein